MFYSLQWKEQQSETKTCKFLIFMSCSDHVSILNSTSLRPLTLECQPQLANHGCRKGNPGPRLSKFHIICENGVILENNEKIKDSSTVLKDCKNIDTTLVHCSRSFYIFRYTYTGYISVIIFPNVFSHWDKCETQQRVRTCSSVLTVCSSVMR